MTTFNRLAARKEIGAIRHRLVEVDLSDTLRHQIIARHLANMLDMLPTQYQSIITSCTVANYTDQDALVTGLDELDELLPATYGSIPAGIIFTLNNGQYFIKRKAGAEYRGIIEPHFEADTIITIVNDRSI